MHVSVKAKTRRRQRVAGESETELKTHSRVLPKTFERCVLPMLCVCYSKVLKLASAQLLCPEVL